MLLEGKGDPIRHTKQISVSTTEGDLLLRGHKDTDAAAAYWTVQRSSG